LRHEISDTEMAGQGASTRYSEWFVDWRRLGMGVTSRCVALRASLICIAAVASAIGGPTRDHNAVFIRDLGKVVGELLGTSLGVWW
jgi:hypothetical protein